MAPVVGAWGIGAGGEIERVPLVRCETGGLAVVEAVSMGTSGGIARALS